MSLETFSHQLRRARRPAAVALLCLFLAWEADAVVCAHRAHRHATKAAAAMLSIRALRADLDRLQKHSPAETCELSRPPSPRPPATGLAEAESTVRDYFRGDAPATQAVDRVAALRREAIEAARTAYLRRVEPPAPAPPPRGPAASNPGGPAAPIHSSERVIEVIAQFDRLETYCLSDLRRASSELGHAGTALTASLAVLVALVAFSIYAERVGRHQKRGARLVEDMLEAYGRRLEAMNVQLEQVNLLKTQFLANTSHELLTPLNGVIGSLEVIRSGSCNSPEDERSFVDQAYQSAERLLALIRDLLDLCRLEEGNLALRCRTLEFGSVLERELAAHRSELAARGLVLLVTPPSGGWPRIAGDPERVTQVMHHLLANALKFTERGSLRVTGRIEGGTRRFLRVEVADTGVGIDPAKLGQVFDLFSQADGSDTRQFGGTGLGLTLSRHLVQGMGGEIGIESDGLGRGTRAWFTLPIALDTSRSFRSSAVDSGALPPFADDQTHAA